MKNPQKYRKLGSANQLPKRHRNKTDNNNGIGLTINKNFFPNKKTTRNATINIIYSLWRNKT
jgi:hypothetical protein